MNISSNNKKKKIISQEAEIPKFSEGKKQSNIKKNTETVHFIATDMRKVQCTCDR